MIKWVADIGSNHNMDFNRIVDLIQTAKRIGCWGVKFQLFDAGQLWTKEQTIRKMRTWELPRSWMHALCTLASGVNLKIGFTPFDLMAVYYIQENKDLIDFIKIGSYEIQYTNLIASAATIGKPMMLSTGLALPDEIELAVQVMKDLSGGAELTLLHCNSNYPAQPSNCNMKKIYALRELGCSVGWSDHSKSLGVIFAALYCGAEVIEFHLDLDSAGWEYGIGHCWLPDEAEEMIRQAKHFFQAISSNGNEAEFIALRRLCTSPEGRRP